MDFSHEDQSSLTEYVHSQFKVRNFNIFVIVFSPNHILCDYVPKQQFQNKIRVSKKDFRNYMIYINTLIQQRNVEYR